jgi:cytoskeletal protein CcmA (bactofilin family)
MAAIFQIRRGTSNASPSLVDGELYLHQGSGSLQFGSGSTKYNTLTLDAPVKGDINLIGNISASGDVRIGGNIYLGDSAASDNISALGIFTTNLVPNGTIDLGTTSAKWNNVYGNSIWGAISASNGVVSGSAQFTGVLSSLNDYTASQNTKNVILASVTASYNTATASLNSFTSSQESKNVIIGNYTSSMNTFTASVNGHISDINTKTGSLEAKNIIIGSYTSSMNTFTASVNGHISDINTKTGSFETKWATLQNVTSSILSYTSSLKSAIELTGSSVTILGNLVVKGTQLLVDSTTIQLGDNILELNGAASANGGLLVKDTTGTSGSLLWDSTNDYWKGGTIGNEEKLLRAGTDGVISGSLSSLNTFSASVNGHITDINTKTGSFETKFTTLGLYTASLDTKNVTLQTLTASMAAQVARLQESTASLNLYTSSQDTKNITLATYTASVSGHIVDINTKTGSFENKFTTLGAYTSSIDTKFTTLQSYTASIDTKFNTLQSLTASNLNRFTRIEESTASLNLFSASINAFYNNFTASLANGGFSASVDKRLDDVEYTVTVLDPGNIGQALLGINLVTQSLQNYTASTNSRFTRIEESTASLNLFTSSVFGHTTDINTWTASVKGHIVDINTKTGSFETKFSTLQTYTASIDTKFTTLQSLTASNLNRFTRIEESTASLNAYTSSNDTTNTSQNTRLNRIEESTASLNLYTSSIATAYESRANATKTIFSGSSQINFTQLSGISANIISSSSDTSNVDMIIAGGSISANLYGGVVSGSSQISSLLPAGVVSGSIQVLGSSTIMSGSSGNYQFNSIGVGTAASTTTGEIRATGDITAYYSSDIRLKENITPIPNALEKVNQISGNTYNWKDGYDEIHSHKGNDVGVIAQEIENVLPQIVTNRDNGYKAVQYEKIVPLLIEAIKELSVKVKELENK